METCHSRNKRGCCVSTCVKKRRGRPGKSERGRGSWRTTPPTSRRWALTQRQCGGRGKPRAASLSGGQAGRCSSPLPQGACPGGGRQQTSAVWCQAAASCGPQPPLPSRLRLPRQGQALISVCGRVKGEWKCALCSSSCGPCLHSTWYSV